MTRIEERDNCKHICIWTTTTLGGFAQCKHCKWIFTDITEKDCEGYVSPEILEKERKAKRLAERIKKREATIAWMNKK